MQSSMYRVGSGTPAYLRVICSNAKADKPGEYAATLKKLLVPTFEEQLKKGVATFYGVDEQYVNTARRRRAASSSTTPMPRHGQVGGSHQHDDE